MPQSSVSEAGHSLNKSNVAGDSKSHRESHVDLQSNHAPTSSFGENPLLGFGSTWNTDNLVTRLSFDAASALSAAALICPIIAIIDRSIIEKASKGLPIRQNLVSSTRNLLTRPHRFIASAPFLLIYMLYSSTYITANVIDTVVSTAENLAPDSISAGPTKFASTAIVNMSLCVYKDSRFAKIFGAQNTNSAPPSSTTPSTSKPPNRPTQNTIPKTSLALFGVRDSLTIFASFNLPPLISPYIPDFLASTPSSKTFLAQFFAPVSIQLLSTPLHLLGLDLFNRQPPGGLAAGDRWTRVKRDWAPACAARVGRILPAFGVGGVVNTRLRERLMRSLKAD